MLLLHMNQNHRARCSGLQAGFEPFLFLRRCQHGETCEEEPAYSSRY